VIDEEDAVEVKDDETFVIRVNRDRPVRLCDVCSCALSASRCVYKLEKAGFSLPHKGNVPKGKCKCKTMHANGAKQPSRKNTHGNEGLCGCEITHVAATKGLAKECMPREMREAEG